MTLFPVGMARVNGKKRAVWYLFIYLIILSRSIQPLQIGRLNEWQPHGDYQMSEGFAASGVDVGTRLNVWIRVK